MLRSGEPIYEQPFVQTVTLSADSPDVELENTIEWRGCRYVRLEQSFPFVSAENAEIHYGVPFGMVRFPESVYQPSGIVSEETGEQDARPGTSVWSGTGWTSRILSEERPSPRITGCGPSGKLPAELHDPGNRAGPPAESVFWRMERGRRFSDRLRGPIVSATRLTPPRRRIGD